MRVRDEVRLGLALLLGLQLATAFAAIWLLGRMAPAIERIITDNVASVEASWEMLAVLAAPEGEDGPARAARAEAFARALQQARRNVTEEEERPLLEGIARHAAGALAGQPADRRVVVEALTRLAAINQRSMQRADERAKRFGIAGAWAMALCGIVGFAIAVVAARRFQARIVEPLAELEEVVLAAYVGDTHRRCRVSGMAAEVGRIGAALNDLLDRRLALAQEEVRRLAAIDRVALMHLLDRERTPLVIVDDTGAIDAANDAAQALFEGPEGEVRRQRLLEAARRREPERAATEVVELVPRPGLALPAASPGRGRAGVRTAEAPIRRPARRAGA
ncbi:MAG: hypothetical protein KatS3mg102_2174 [Planctomycetota bacterium]|nr:MAG: hypothetical protein KatS3mg102_2174 [Planctomycetota bacterium]